VKATPIRGPNHRAVGAVAPGQLVLEILLSSVVGGLDAMGTRAMRVGISGSYGGLNLGDEAILHVILAELGQAGPMDVTVFSRDVIVAGVFVGLQLSMASVSRSLPVNTGQFMNPTLSRAKTAGCPRNRGTNANARHASDWLGNVAPRDHGCARFRASAFRVGAVNV
jgi:hypothetical protein